MTMPSHMTFRIDRDIQKAFVHLCEQKGTTASIAMREFIDQQLKSTDAFSRWDDAGRAMRRRHADERQNLVDRQEAMDVRHRAETKKAEGLDIMEQMAIEHRQRQEVWALENEIDATLELHDNEKIAHKHKAR